MSEQLLMMVKMYLGHTLKEPFIYLFILKINSF